MIIADAAREPTKINIVIRTGLVSLSCFVGFPFPSVWVRGVLPNEHNMLDAGGLYLRKFNL